MTTGSYGVPVKSRPVKVSVVPWSVWWATTKAPSASENTRSALKASTTEAVRGASVPGTGAKPSGPRASTPSAKAGSGERSTNCPAPFHPAARAVVSVNIK